MTTYNILINNNSPNSQDFFIFQTPAKYVGGGKIFSNSIHQTRLSAGAQATVTIEREFYAGVQSATAAPKVGSVSGSDVIEKPVNLAPGPDDQVTVELDPLSLTPPKAGNGVESGAFRIVTPSYKPSSTGLMNIGLATATGGRQVLSSFIQAEPNKNTDCQPIVTFYVATGIYTAGTVINFDSSSVNAAECDASTGSENFVADYPPNGEWNVTPVSESAFKALVA